MLETQARPSTHVVDFGALIAEARRERAAERDRLYKSLWQDTEAKLDAWLARLGIPFDARMREEGRDNLAGGAVRVWAQIIIADTLLFRVSWVMLKDGGRMEHVREAFAVCACCGRRHPMGAVTKLPDVAHALELLSVHVDSCTGEGS